jgi:SNF2 family DNA or RNA helicase
MMSLTWPAPLRAFQEEGISALAARPALLLADDMGLGKTIQCIAALRILFEQERVRRVLVVVPAGLLTQWRRELYRWAPEVGVMRVDGPAADRRWKWRADKQLYLASYDTVRSDARTVLDATWDVVVLDEAQRIKNRRTAVSQV